MRDRVCLTCRYWRKDADYPDVLGNCGYSVMTARENCRQWTERTDSVERIALDMWRDLGRSIKYAYRLRALGVEVSQ